MSSPGRVISTGIGAVQLEASHVVVASIHEANSERSRASGLSVEMHFVAEMLD